MVEAVEEAVVAVEVGLGFLLFKGNTKKQGLDEGTGHALKTTKEFY